MNRKILFTLSLALIAAIMVSAVSADENVTIDGIDFNIPDGYIEDVDSEIINETDSDDGVDYISNGKFYDNGDNTMLILIATFEGENGSDDALAEVDGENLTINNVEGKLADMGLIKVFCYVKDGKLVTLTTNVQDEIEKFII